MYYFECIWLLRIQLKVLSLEEFTFLLSQVKERSDFWDCLEVKQFHNFSHHPITRKILLPFFQCLLILNIHVTILIYINREISKMINQKPI